MKSSAKTAAARRSAGNRPAGNRPATRTWFARPAVLVPVLLLSATAVALGVQYYRKAATAAAARAELLSRVDEETAKPNVDSSELSRLIVQIHKLPDHETSRDLQAAVARIELARDRPEKAFAAFGITASRPSASPADQALGARILLRLHEAGGGDAAVAIGRLQQALGFAENAYRASDDVSDLLCAWQAAVRLGDQAVIDRLSARLREQHASSAAARLAGIAATFDPRESAADLAAVRAEFTAPVVELEAMHVLVVLQSGEIDQAVTAAEALLGRAPGVLAVRWAASLVFHACALGHAADSAERGSWVVRRDAQLDWLLQRAAVDDARRERWAHLRNQR